MSEQHGWRAVQPDGNASDHVYLNCKEDEAWVILAYHGLVTVARLRAIGWRMEPVTITPRRAEAVAPSGWINGGAFQRTGSAALFSDRSTYDDLDTPLYAVPITTPAAPAAPRAEALHGPTIGPLHEDEVQWVTNDNAELGVKIGRQFFFLYKGASLVYKTGLHDDGTPLLWRFVNKREFGECCHPINYKNPQMIGTVSVHDGEEWHRLPPATPPAAQENG